MRPDVDAVVVHWEAPDWCRKTVDSLLASANVGVVVTVINNGGRVLLPASVAVLDVGDNLGFAAGANLGLDLASGRKAPWVFIGCHDLRLEPSAMEAMIRQLEVDDGLGITGPVLDGAGGEERDLDWISGAGMLMRREVAETFRFDVRWGSYVEDVDFCYRVRNAGWRVGRCGTANGTTAGSVDPLRKLQLMHSNTVAFFVFRHSWGLAARRVALIARRTLVCAFRGQLAEALAYGKAIPIAIIQVWKMRSPWEPG